MTPPSPVCLQPESASSPALTMRAFYAFSQTLLASVASGVLLLDGADHVTFANPTAEGMFGCGTAALAGLPFAEVFQPGSKQDASDDVPARTAPTLPGEPSEKGELLCRNGVKLPVRVTVRSLTNVADEVLASVVTIDDLSDYMQMGEYVQLMADYDAPTGLPKMETMLRGLEAKVVRLHSCGKKFALLRIDTDHLHRIRESLSHEAGVTALREIGKRLGTRLGQHDLLTRYTGDGFAILLHECACEEDATRQGAALMRVFEEPFQIDNYSLKITASIGISFGSDAKTTQSSMLAHADFALRRSVSLGGNRVTWFLPEMMDWHSNSVQMEAQMQAALEQERFFIMYQPQICLETGRLVGVEALLRWSSQVDGLVMPGTFIPIAEESGLIVQLGAWCLQRACHEIVQLQQRLGHRVRLAVNVSPKQVHAKGFLEMVEASLESSGLPPECLEIEITEGLLMSHEDEVLRVISKLQSMGVTAAIDDFGMGFSNLGYIMRFKVDRLKIDRSFVGRCTSDRSSQMIIASITFLAQSLGIEIVAEGVETQEQALMLSGLKCEIAQGYLYARPMTLDQVFAASKTFVVPKQLAMQQASEAFVLESGEKASEEDHSEAPSAEVLATHDEVVESISASLPSDDSIPTAVNPEVTGKAVEVKQYHGSAGKKSGAGVSLEPLLPREPACRPSRPMRMQGATRVSFRQVEESADLLPML